jgi:hypothetical protein
MDKYKIDIFLFCLRYFVDNLIFLSESSFSLLWGLGDSSKGLFSSSSIILVS